MSNSIAPTRFIPFAPSSGLFTRLARAAVHKSLGAIGSGEVVIRDGGSHHSFGGKDQGSAPAAVIDVHDQRFYAAAAFGGTVGAGESYMRGEWSCSDLTALIRLMVMNRPAMDRLEGGPARLALPFLKWYHRVNENTVEGSRRNIAAHYDLGNEFYQVFLDGTMCYSSGIFENEESTLEDASVAKMDRLCRKLRLGPQDHLLEIGTGWGSLAIHAARHYGCRVTTTTISGQQYDFARDAVERAGLSGRITLLKEDYRDLRGQYSRIVSVEMIEAVGWQYYETFMRQCAALLEPDGLLAMQAITIRDHLFEQARRSVDFIQRCIFPGSCIPSVTALLSAASRASDLVLTHHEDITPHYARTLREWRWRFLANSDRVRALGFPEEFLRMWEFYLCYCEGGFIERNIGAAQMVFARASSRHEPLLPALPR